MWAILWSDGQCNHRWRTHPIPPSLCLCISPHFSQRPLYADALHAFISNTAISIFFQAYLFVKNYFTLNLRTRITPPLQKKKIQQKTCASEWTTKLSGLHQDSPEFLLDHRRKVYACCTTTTGWHVLRLVPPEGSRRATAANSHVSLDRFVRTETPVANPSNPLTTTRNVVLDEGKNEAVRGSARGL